MVTGNSGKPNRPTFSLVFLTWNSAADIERTLDSVLEQTYSNFEVVVVDNNSDDETVSIVQTHHISENNVRLIENETNLGFTDGINRGIEATHGKYICCYNDDTYFPENYLQTLSKNVRPNAVWTTARINHRVSSEHETVRLLTQNRFPIPYMVDSLSGITEVNYLPGDGLIVPRQIYDKKLGNLIFDPAMPEKGEDLELSLRLRNKDVPMKAILDTYSIHPDEGFYSPTIENGLNHLKNVSARFHAYRKNGFGPIVLLSVLMSTITVPIEIYLRPFPRDSGNFV